MLNIVEGLGNIRQPSIHTRTTRQGLYHAIAHVAVGGIELSDRGVFRRIPYVGAEKDSFSLPLSAWYVVSDGSSDGSFCHSTMEWGSRASSLLLWEDVRSQAIFRHW